MLGEDQNSDADARDVLPGGYLHRELDASERPFGQVLVDPLEFFLLGLVDLEEYLERLNVVLFGFKLIRKGFG